MSKQSDLTSSLPGWMSVVPEEDRILTGAEKQGQDLLQELEKIEKGRLFPPNIFSPNVATSLSPQAIYLLQYVAQFNDQCLQKYKINIRKINLFDALLHWHVFMEEWMILSTKLSSLDPGLDIDLMDTPDEDLHSWAMNISAELQKIAIKYNVFAMDVWSH